MALAIVAGPLVALVNQGSIYAASAWGWGCTGTTRATMHGIAAICFAVAIATAARAVRWQWRLRAAVKNGGSDEVRRSHFMTVVATSTALFGSLLILWQWFAVALFAPCVRS